MFFIRWSYEGLIPFEFVPDLQVNTNLYQYQPVLQTTGVDVCIYPTPPNEQNMTQGQFFKRSLTCLIQSFSSPKLVAISRLKIPLCPNILHHSKSGNSWIHSFPKDISTMGNANSLVQESNTCRSVHFLQW